MSGSDDFDEWALEATEFWLGSFGGFEAFRTRAHLALPTEEDFPVDAELDDEELARDYLAFAQVHARLEQWTFELTPEESFHPSDVLRGVPHDFKAEPFSSEPLQPLADGAPRTIPYSRYEVRDPTSLVATIASGMSHYHLYEALLPVPDEQYEREYYVDHGAVLLGFGIFIANSAFRFIETGGDSRGGRWGFERRTALNEHDVSSVLALYTLLLEVSEREVAEYLAPNPKAYFHSARARLTKKRSGRLDELRRVKGRSLGPFR